MNISGVEVIIHPKSRTVTLSTHADPIRLTPIEHRILMLLLDNPNRIIPHPEMMLKVWNTTWCGDLGTLHVHMCTLKKKLPVLTIESIKTVGYQLVIP
ncbi:MAG: hypothetical protein A2Z04_06765 [Chloroflexi bacterium RBG_16_57_9]|nr:MAG: hypothetical protein A2Z04_06765 [Chloroflexi bacterium RBG_16_57_9]